MFEAKYEPRGIIRSLEKSHLSYLQQKTIENIVAKGEIAQNEQFLLLHQCFQTFLRINISLMEILSRFCIKVFKSILLQNVCMLERVNQ